VRHNFRDHIHRERPLRIDRFARKLHLERNAHAASIYKPHNATVSRMHSTTQFE
jgi:hypothetical protein